MCVLPANISLSMFSSRSQDSRSLVGNKQETEGGGVWSLAYDRIANIERFEV